MMAATLTVTATRVGDLLGSAAGAHASTRIVDLVLDSRDVRPGAAFVAVQGGREHGLVHAADAFARGAAVMLYEPPAPDGEAALGGGAETPGDPPEGREHDVPPPQPLPAEIAARSIAVPGLKSRLGELARKFYGPALGTPELCGITGTNGKTTVAYLLAQAMTLRGEACGYVGTLGYGIPPQLATHALTTPDCFTLHRELIALGTGHAAMEVSSHALAQRRIAGLRFHTAAFTNLSRDHLDAHGDLESYGRAKARLFGVDGLRNAVLNVGDAYGRTLAESLPPGVEAIRVRVDGNDDGVDIAAAARPRGLEGLELEISGRYGEARLVSPLIGDFNAENLLVALGVLVAWQVPLAEACARLAACHAAPGRLEVVRAPGEAAQAAGAAGGNVPCVVVDYAHTPAGLERVLDVLAGITAGELWCVFGCGGERDRGKRPIMGAIAAQRADHIVLTDDNPRGEDPTRIVDDIFAGVTSHPRAEVVHDRHAAIMRAVRRAGPRDVVLIAGKGHETAQTAGGIARPFSDRAVALEALEARGARA